MSTTFKDFSGKSLLFEAQSKGEEISKEFGIQIKAAADAELIGLAAILVERGIRRELQEMMKKLTDFVNFPGKDLLLEAQERGQKIGEDSGVMIKTAADAELIGLAAILVERGVLNEDKKKKKA